MLVLMISGSRPGMTGCSSNSRRYWPAVHSIFSSFRNQKPSLFGWALCTSFNCFSATGTGCSDQAIAEQNRRYNYWVGLFLSKATLTSIP